MATVVFFDLNCSVQTTADHLYVSQILNLRRNLKHVLYPHIFHIFYNLYTGQAVTQIMIRVYWTDCVFHIHTYIHLTGNTVLHMLVIHNKLDMFDLVVDMSSSNGKKPEEAQSLLHIKNHKGSYLTDSCCNSFLSD